MQDVAIVGAGLCGLALGYRLQTLGLDYGMYEARSRLGGRIHGTRSVLNGAPLDLGPTWFWPQAEPHMRHWVAELALEAFPQHDTGTVTQLQAAHGTPQTRQAPGLHGGAQRLAGGMATLAGALAARIDAGRIHLDHALTALLDRGDHVELHFEAHGELTVRTARRVVVALPPRLADEHVLFSPELPPELRTAMRNTPTWMGAMAKIAVAYPAAFWRARGASGNAFVTHDQAVLTEVWDACDKAGGGAALGGFLALPLPDPGELPALIHDQLAQLFGTQTQDSELHIQDWRREAYTTSALDRAQPMATPEELGNPRLAAVCWNGRLLLGGTETAPRGGHMEGALAAAARIEAQLLGLPAQGASRSDMEAALGEFGSWVAQQRGRAFSVYEGRLKQALSSHRSQDLTRHCLLAAVQALYQGSLTCLKDLGIPHQPASASEGAALTRVALAAFEGFNEELLGQALAFNRTSCAMSNFPGEHQPGVDYLNRIRTDLRDAWRRFAFDMHDLLMAGRST